MNVLSMVTVYAFLPPDSSGGCPALFSAHTPEHQ